MSDLTRKLYMLYKYTCIYAKNVSKHTGHSLVLAAQSKQMHTCLHGMKVTAIWFSWQTLQSTESSGWLGRLRKSTCLTFISMYTFTSILKGCLHIAHWSSVIAHWTQAVRWPQGMNITSSFSLKHILHSKASETFGSLWVERLFLWGNGSIWSFDLKIE